jgi:hypothetical protein
MLYRIFKCRSEKGNVAVIALMMLMVLTLLGISITRTTSIDVQIAGSEIPNKQNFYVAEGGVNREAAEVGVGNYPVINIDTPTINTSTPLATEASNSPRHKVAGADYDFTLDYLGYFVPPPGYSVIHFNRYDYRVDAFGDPTGSRVRVGSRYYKIGPKAE